jgi:PAS domain S-box-containing protein
MVNKSRAKGPEALSLKLARLLQEHEDELVDRISRRVVEMAEGIYAQMPLEEIRLRVAAIYESIQRNFAEDPGCYAAFWEKIGQERARQGYTIKDLQDVISAVRQVLAEFIAGLYADDLETMLTMTHLADDIHDSSRVKLSEAYTTTYQEAMTERKRAEEALAQERNLLRTLIDNLPDFVYVKDLESRFILNNVADARIMGLTPDEVVGKNDFDFFSRELAEGYYATEQEIIRSGQPVIGLEEPIEAADGKKGWLLTTKVPLRDSQGKIIGTMGIGRDITERKRIEEALAQERNLLRTLIDNLPDIVYAKDTESRFILGNIAVGRLMGAATPGELVGKSDFDFYSQELAAQYYADEQEVVHSGQALFSREEPLVDLTTGRKGWLSTTKVPLRDSQGEIVGIVGIGRDITERKQTEEALAQERNLLRTLIDNLPDLVYTKDTESRFVLGNIAVGRLLGAATPGELIGKSDFDFYSQELAAQYYADEQEVIQSGQPLFSREEPLVDLTTGKRGWLSTTKVPLRDSQGEIVGIVGIGRDITERKQTEEALERRVKQLTGLNQLSQAVTASLELEQVLDEVVSLIGKVVDSDYTSLVRVEEGRLIHGAEIEPGVPDLEHRARPTGHTSWIAHTRQAVIVDDIASDGTIISQTPAEAPGTLNPRMVEAGVKSFAGVPLIAKDRLLGVLYLHSLRPYHFHDQLPLLSTYANQAAVAIENARLFEETRKRASQLHAAAEISRAASSILDPDELLRQAVDLIQQRFDLYYTGIFLLDDEGRYAVLRAGTGEAGRKMLERGHKLEVGSKSMIGWCVANAQARIALDVGKEAVRFENPLLPDTRSEMALPLISRGQVIGALTVQSAEVAAFSEEDIAILQTMADQLANAIQNARLFGQTQAALQEVTAVHRQYVREEWRKYMAAQSAEERTGYLYDATREAPAGRLRTPQIEQAIRQGGTVALTQHPAKSEPAGGSDGPAQAALVTPITLRGQPIGALGFEEPERAREWTEEEIALVEGVANQLALAVENARLFEQTQETLEETSTLYQTASRFAEAATVQEIIDIVAEQVQEMLSGEFSGGVYLAGPDPGKPAEWIETRARWDLLGGSLQATIPLGSRFPASQHPLLRLFPNPRQPVLVADMLTDERVDEAARQMSLHIGARSITVVPLVTPERWLGIITASRAEARVPDERQMRLLRALADRAAVAIENRLLFEQTQALARRESLINEITARVRGSMDLDTIMQTAVQELGKALGGTAFIRLGTEAQLLPAEFKTRLDKRGQKLPGDGDSQSGNQ